MLECEVWVDVECQEAGAGRTVCGLFSRQSFAVRPAVGESVSFHQGKQAAYQFRLQMAWGDMPASHVSLEVESVSHYRSPGSPFTTSLRCTAIRVPSLVDARRVVELLCDDHGFEVDPYGVNQLESAS